MPPRQENPERSNISPELSFFLPPTNSAQSREWSLEPGRQLLYAQCCVHGMNQIANRVAQGLTGERLMPTMFDIYKMAARSRFQMAQIMPNPDRGHDYETGMPEFDADIHHIIPEPKGVIPARWGQEFPSIKDYFKAIWDAQQDYEESGKTDQDARTRIQKLIGNDIITRSGMDIGILLTDSGNKIGTERNFRTLYFERRNEKGDHYPYGSIRMSPDEDQIEIFNIPWKYRDYAFHEADTFLGNMVRINTRIVALSNRDASETRDEKGKFNENFATLAKLLYDANPCAMGGQTATMMVIGGIQKAFGYPVKKSDEHRPVYDFTFDANLASRSVYARDRFVANIGDLDCNKTSSSEIVSKMPVDENFYSGTRKPDWSRFQGDLPLDHLLNRAVTIWYDQPFENFHVLNQINSSDGRLHITVTPSQAQERVDYLVDWLGKDLFCKAFNITI